MPIHWLALMYLNSGPCALPLLPSPPSPPRSPLRRRGSWLCVTTALGFTMGTALSGITYSAPLEGAFSDPLAACYSADSVTVVCAGDWSQGVLIDNPGEGADFTRLYQALPGWTCRLR